MKISKNEIPPPKLLILIVAVLGVILASQLLHGLAAQSQKAAGAVTVQNPFRFPEKGNIQPLLSPDGRWIVFREVGDQTRGWFYTEVGKEEKNPLPLAKRKVPGTVIPAQACWSREGKTLALLARIDGTEQIVLVSFASSVPRFIASIPETEIECPVWLESGELLFLAATPGRIMVANSKGKVKTLMTHVGSPSGRGLHFFQATAQGDILYHAGTAIYLKKIIDSGKVTKVCETQEPLRFSLSPNGRFALLDGGSTHPDQVLLLDLAASRVKESLELAKNLHLELVEAKVVVILPKPLQSEWSPDGARLACREKGPDGLLCILDAVSGARREIKTMVGSFAWMPDGQRILFSTSSEVHPGLFVMSAGDGKVIGKVSPIAAADPPVLSADGKVIVWQAREAEAFYVARIPLVNLGTVL